MIQNRTCRECSRSFKGGPRAYYCPECRYERQKKRDRERQAKKRKGIGAERPLGSLDKCERCKKEYTVNAGLQRFCENCQIAHKLEYDHSRAMPKYEKSKERLNPARNYRRRVGERNCDWCGNAYTQTNKQLTCSAECKRLLKNKKWNDWNNKK